MELRRDHGDCRRQREGTGNEQAITKVLNVTTKEGRIPGVPDLQYKLGKAAVKR